MLVLTMSQSKYPLCLTNYLLLQILKEEFKTHIPERLSNNGLCGLQQMPLLGEGPDDWFGHGPQDSLRTGRDDATVS